MPPLVEHVLRGGAFGAVVGGAIAGVGWVVRARNAMPVDLGVDAPALVATQRPFAELLLHFQGISHHTADTQRWYADLVACCEHVAASAGATGGAQGRVQAAATRAMANARALVNGAIAARDMNAYQCKTYLDEVQGHLNGLVRAMLVRTS